MEAGDLPPEAREVFRYLDSEVEWNTAFAGVSFRGRLECARGFDWLLEAVEHYSLTLQEVTDLGDAQVLAVMDRALKGSDSGIEVSAPLFSVITLRDGLIVRNDEYSDRTEALEAAELSE
jgi:ketosteroid isomerase-like protein